MLGVAYKWNTKRIAYTNQKVFETHSGRIDKMAKDQTINKDSYLYMIAMLKILMSFVVVVCHFDYSTPSEHSRKVVADK